MKESMTKEPTTHATRQIKIPRICKSHIFHCLEGIQSSRSSQLLTTSIKRFFSYSSQFLLENKYVSPFYFKTTSPFNKFTIGKKRFSGNSFQSYQATSVNSSGALIQASPDRYSASIHNVT